MKNKKKNPEAQLLTHGLVCCKCFITESKAVCLMMLAFKVLAHCSTASMFKNNLKPSTPSALNP